MRDPNYIPDWAEQVARLRIDDERATTSTSPRPTRTPSQRTMPAAGEAYRSSSRSLAKLRDLPASAVLLLFTPVMVPSGFLNDARVDAKASEISSAAVKKIDTDPFELLGKALSEHHRRIRHVPYVPSVGFTETHDAFLSQADGVIIVTCEPERMPGRSKVELMEVALAKQASFAENTAVAVIETEKRAPIVNFHFGDDEWAHNATEYVNIWAGERYSKESVAQIVHLLFGGRK